MTTLRDFIASRKSAIKSEIRDLRKELNDLKLAEAALSGQKLDAGQDESPPSLTIKDMIRAVLRNANGPLMSPNILQEIQSDFGRAIERTSLSPQLSRMKDDGEVYMTELGWLLTVTSPASPTEIQSDEPDWSFEEDEIEPPF